MPDCLCFFDAKLDAAFITFYRHLNYLLESVPSRAWASLMVAACLYLKAKSVYGYPDVILLCLHNHEIDTLNTNGLRLRVYLTHAV